MLLVDDKPFFPYALLTDQGPVLGLDRRSLAEIEAEWLAKSKRSAERDASHTRALIRAEIENQQLAAKKIKAEEEKPEFPIVLSSEGVGGSPRADHVTLDDVAQPPAEVLGADEVLRLMGIPGGYGAASVLASAVSGVAHAWGDAADDICAVVPVRELRTRVKKKQHGSRKTRHRREDVK